MKKQSIIALAALSFLFINCKPKSVEKEVSGTDSLSVSKDSIAIKQTNDVFFKASGTEPFWGIEIMKDSVRFTSPETEKNFTLSYGKPNRAMDANVISYEAKSDSIHLKFTIQQGKCSDGMSDNEYNYHVNASLKRGKDKDFKNLEGCGNYIVDKQLEGNWILEELEGKKINPDDFEKKLPGIEINANESKFTGFAGCNGMGGKLFYETEILRFTDVFTTEMMCPNYDKEKLFVKALQSTTTYQIKKDKLYLLNPDGTKAVLRKAN